MNLASNCCKKPLCHVRPKKDWIVTCSKCGKVIEWKEIIDLDRPYHTLTPS